MTIRKMTFFILLLAVLNLMGFGFLAIGSDRTAADRAADMSGPFTLSAGARIYIATDRQPEPELIETARTMSAMFAAAEVPSSQELPLRYGERAWADTGDIVLVLATSYAPGQPTDAAQGFTLAPAADGTLEITAGTADGIWYGLTELLQRCLCDEGTIAESVTSVPESPERTLLLDCGRKYYSRSWIQNLIRRMSWQRYTSLHLHFSDAEGFGLQSKRYPWLNEEAGSTAEEITCLTYDDLTAICETARQYHIEIIPELDSPGHLRYIVERYAAHAANEPDFTFEYQGRTYSAADEGGSNISNYYVYRGARSAYSNTGIDLSNETAVAFLGSLIDEYADFFAAQGSTRFCIGGDELFGWNGASVGGRSFTPYELWAAMEHWASYARDHLGIENGSASDTFVSYLNDLNAHLNEKGLSCRVWNDQLLRTEDQTVSLDPAIDIIYWTNDYTPMQRLAEGGNRIFSSNTDWCYYVIRQDRRGGDIMDRTRKYCASRYIYENWDPRNCAGPKQEETLIPEESFTGGYFCIWADSPNYKTAQTVWEDTDIRTWANSSKLWDHDMDETLSYEQFRSRVDALRAFPGFSGDCETYTALSAAPKPQPVQPGTWERVKRTILRFTYK